MLCAVKCNNAAAAQLLPQHRVYTSTLAVAPAAPLMAARLAGAASASLRSSPLSPIAGCISSRFFFSFNARNEY
jgi:hypothetical protein